MGRGAKLGRFHLVDRVRGLAAGAALVALSLSTGCGPSMGGPLDLGGTDSGLPPRRACTTRFSYAADRALDGVAVAGEWNKFDPSATPMTEEGGRWSVEVELPVGAHAYKLVTREASGALTWLLDPETPYTKYVGHEENSLVEVDDCQTPLLQFVSLDKSPDGALRATVQYLDGALGAGLDPARLEVLLDGAPLSAPELEPGGRVTVSAIGLARDKHRLVVRAADGAGRAAKELLIPFWIEAEPFDFRDGLLYFVFTDRFRNGDLSNDAPAAGVAPIANYGGGDFAGVIAALEEGYFEALGVRTLWLSPPNANPDHGELGADGRPYSGYHGYWPTSGTSVQPRFGDLDRFRQLIKAAHSRGIRVIVDSVLNHVHVEHPLYQQHKTDGWFNGDGGCVCGGPGCDWDTHVLDCWFTSYLPDVNYESFDAMRQMIDDALFWAKELDVDGFRVDAVKHFAHAPTRRLRAKLRDELEHVGPLYYLVGETFTGQDQGGRDLIKSFIGPSELHAQFDFPVYWAALGALGTYSQTLRSLEATVSATDATFGSAPMSPFFGNHDVTRFVSEAAIMISGDSKEQAWSSPPGPPPDSAAYYKLQMALTFLGTQPGVPLLYYGDEYGLPGAGDPDNRRPMKWSGFVPDEDATLAHARKVGQARAELRALRRGDRRTLWVDDDLYVYARTAGTEVAIVAINRSWTPRQQAVPVPQDLPLGDGLTLGDRLGGPSLGVSGQQLAVDLPGHASAVYAP